MKDAILETIYTAFAEWAPAEQFYCAPGCSTCCTRNVTITALEGRRILQSCLKMKGGEWAAQLLGGLHPHESPLRTTNEYVEDILQDRRSCQSQVISSEKCPFLADNRCAIYHVRPFSCRCFFSTSPCGDSGAAVISDTHVYASMAVMQLIEHLGQFEFWGNMVDVLVVLLHLPEFGNFAKVGNPELLHHARTHIRRARPLPGFIIPPEEKAKIDPLLHAIFQTRLGRKTVEQILNGR